MSQPQSDVPLPLLEHLDELRRRIILSLACFIVLSAAGYYFVDPILNWLARPVGDFVFTSPTDALFVRFQIAFTAGGIFTAPILIFHVWRFIEMALYPKERRWVRAMIPAAALLFFVGMALAFFVVAPTAAHFLLQFSGPHLRPLISIQDYLSFLFWMIVGFGVFFQLPMVVVVLSKMGIVNPWTLGRYRRHVIIGIFIAAAVLTPGPDIFSQLVMALPAYLLFECSLLIAKRLSPG